MSSCIARLLAQGRQKQALRTVPLSVASLSTKAQNPDPCGEPSANTAPWIAFAALACAVSVAVGSASSHHVSNSEPRKKEDDSAPESAQPSQVLGNAAKELKGMFDNTLFDKSKQWEENEQETTSFFKSLISSQNDSNESNENDTDSAGGGWFQPKGNEADFSSFYRLLSGHAGNKSIADVAATARDLMSDDDSKASASLTEVVEAGMAALERLDKTMSGFFGGAEPPILRPHNLHYWIEHEEEKKNPGWKRRKHRFCQSLDESRVEELDAKLHFANLCYADTLDEIRDELENKFDSELLYCIMESRANQPSHFISAKREQPAWSNHLEVSLVVRGTKTMTDVITDILLDESEYRGGTAHSGILESGRYLANKHKAFLRQLCELSGKSKIKLSLIGHSLGAGAAAIAGMELNDEDFIDVEVVGFGAPAILSKELSESTKGYITTVIADNDCVPRMSAATLVNAVLDINENDWTPSALRDIEDAITLLHESVPVFMRGDKDALLKSIEEMVSQNVEIPEPSTKRMTPTLFPPGECVHFYRDGFGISATMVPCTLFSEIDCNWRMVNDHLYASGYKLIFLDYMRYMKQDHYFQFETDKLKTVPKNKR